MNDIWLFWAVLFAFLIFDNLVFISPGKDCLSIGRCGKPFYKSRQRNYFSACEVVFLNPFNLFDRVIISEKVTVAENRQHYKKELKSLQSLTLALNVFGYLGYFYFAYLAAHFYLSVSIGFEAVVPSLLLGHLIVWLCAVVIVIFHIGQRRLPLSGVVATLLECLFVPAYLINLNKKLLRLRSSSISVLRFHVRKIRRAQPADIELFRYELLNQIHAAMDTEVERRKHELLQEFAKCLHCS